jgi:hypothetical protein
MRSTRSTHKLHRVSIKPPFYGDGRNAGLHRYLDGEFISRFQQDLRGRRFQQPQFSDWLAEEIHSPHDTTPVLRLPAHRAFHLVCVEVVCEQLGHPALCPRRITTPGFVIRRIGGEQELAWVVEDGEPLGWQAAPTELRDPDIYRRLCASGILHKRTDEPAFSGEQTHPLHAFNTEDADGRVHTLLYGFVPLGGFYYRRDTTDAFDRQSQEQVEAAAAEQLLWPFGYRESGDQIWQDRHSRPVDSGRPSKSMFELVRMLVSQYHLGESHVEGNDALERLVKQFWFFDPSTLPSDLRGLTYKDEYRSQLRTYRRFNLWTYLQGCFGRGENNPLPRWIARQEEEIDAKGGLDGVSQMDKLPAIHDCGSAVHDCGRLKHTLLISAADAQNLRDQLGQRFRDQTLEKVREIPLPKFGQDAEDIYQIVPFVRFKNDDGNEQIQWAESIHSRSQAFRVAAPFDPQASRPSLIQMPSLADLKRGLATGASMITPADTFNLIKSLNHKKGASADALPADEPGPGLGLQWICSFSLPAITLVAMILLMIMISLLNIVFFWMPWVRICLPFPKINKS